MTIDLGAAARIAPPTRSWTRSHGSKCAPSARRHSMYLSIGISGYRSFQVGRTGAMTLESPAVRAVSVNVPIIRLES
jgi:hypothetical protein